MEKQKSQSPCFIVLGARSTMDVAMELRADEWLEVATLWFELAIILINNFPSWLGIRYVMSTGAIYNFL